MPVHHQTFNMADRGSYACIYGGKLMVTAINHHQPVNVEQSASERWTPDRQIFAIRIIYVASHKYVEVNRVCMFGHKDQILKLQVTMLQYIYSKFEKFACRARNFEKVCRASFVSEHIRFRSFWNKRIMKKMVLSENIPGCMVVCYFK